MCLLHWKAHSLPLHHLGWSKMHLCVCVCMCVCVCVCVCVYWVTQFSWVSQSCQFSWVSQSCPTLCNPMDCSPPGSSVHEISQARILELPFPSPGDLPGPGTEPASPVSPTLQTDSLPLSHWGSPRMQLGFPKEHRTFKCYICSDIKLTSLHLPISFHRTE